MLDNTAVGHRNLVHNFGPAALPSITWQIDPFGHSAFQGIMSSSLSGFQGLMYAREAADFKQASAATQSLERVWLPSASLGPAAASFQGIFIDRSYTSPLVTSACSSRASNASCSFAAGSAQGAAVASDVFLNRRPLLRGQDVLLLAGGDFTMENAVPLAASRDSGSWFAYLDGIMDHLNADPWKRFSASYSSPAAYVRAKLAAGLVLPTLVTDMFPYNDDPEGHNMWSGYFTSRPAFKGFVRESSALQSSARQLQALVGGVADVGPGNPLFALERAMGVAQHHDSVSGTAKQNVDEDYRLILSAARAQALGSVSSSLAAATGYSAAAFCSCELSNVTVCASLEAGLPTVLAVHNALGQAAAAAPVRLPVGLPAGTASYAVLDAQGASVTAQLVPLSQRDRELRQLYNGSAAVQVAWLCFVGALPAAGFSSFFLLPKASLAEAPHTHLSTVVALGAGGSSSQEDAQISNGRLTLNISAATGFLSYYEDAATHTALPLRQQWLSYIGFDGQSALRGSTQASGAYIFRPLSETPEPLQQGPASVLLVSGPVVSEAQSSYGYVTQATRLWAGSGSVEVEWTVGPVNVSGTVSHEVSTRYDSGLATGGKWTTDSNCHESQARALNWRGNWTVNISEPVSGNYFPTNCLIKASSSELTLAVAVDRSEGSSSLADGQLELMVHRRLCHDDKRGVAEPLNEPGLDGQGLIVRGRHWLLAAPVAAAPAAYKGLLQQALALPTTVSAAAQLGSLQPSQWLAAYKGSASLLRQPLPPSVHLATVHLQGPQLLLLRLSHLFEAGEDPVLSANVTVSLATLLAGPLSIVAAEEMTLPGALPLAAVPQTTYFTEAGQSITVPVLPAAPAGPGLDIVLSAMQIRVFRCTLG